MRVKNGFQDKKKRKAYEGRGICEENKIDI